MAYARARRHYRVAQEQAQQAYQKGLFIPDDKKTKIMVGVGIVLFMVFLKGLLFGMLCSRNDD